jgi:[NiFe] hydrogenase assembly HybE family chaperone
MTDPGPLLPDPSPRLEAAFRAVDAERMQGLPFVNAAIDVEAIGFAPWRHYWLGVMLTPWSMNLLLAPREPGAWRPLPPGDKRRYTFPAGIYDFIGAREESIGEYLVCSLFSPVLEFADHATARQTATFALEALFDPANAEDSELRAANLNRISTDTGPAEEATPRGRADASLGAPVSRRDFLHPRIRADTDEHRR